MKKQITIILIGLMLVSLATAMTFSSKQDAIDEITNKKQIIENIDTKEIKITMISNKECIINFDTEETESCEACFKITLGEIESNSCAKLEEFSTIKDDNIKIREKAEFEIRRKITEIQKEETISYISRETIGDKI